MKTKLDFEDKNASLALAGEITQTALSDNFFETKLAAKLLNDKIERIVVNGAEIDRVDTAGLAWLLNIMRDAKSHGIQTEFENLPPKLLELANLSGAKSLLTGEKNNDQ